MRFPMEHFSQQFQLGFWLMQKKKKVKSSKNIKTSNEKYKESLYAKFVISFK